MIATSKKVDTDYLFEINGFKVRDNSIYEIIDRPDPTAPSGMVKARLSKTPQKGVGDVYCVNGEANSMGKYTWDTGFYPESPCYFNYPDEASKKTMMNAVVKNVLKPFRNIHGEEAFDHKNNQEFFDTWSFRLASKRKLNTAKPEERMELYFALLTGFLAPEEDYGHPRYKDSFYMVVDIDKVTKTEDEMYTLQASVISQTQTLITTDKSKLIAVLMWMDLPVVQDTEPGTLTRIIGEYTKDSVDRSKSLISLISQAETQLGLDKFNVHRKLKEISQTRLDKLSKTAGGVWFYDGIEVGGDLKTAADRISREANFEQIKVQILNS